jgi:DNA-binding LacI/PurR family transcriptional regulator
VNPIRRSTLKDVAQTAGVSYQTVSKVVNRQKRVTPETEARIWQAIQELDYHPSELARSLRSRQSRAIGYSLVPSHLDQINPILDRFLESMMATAEVLGYAILAFPHDSDRDKQLSAYRVLMESGRVDAFVLPNVEYDDPRIPLLEQNRFPFIAFGRSNPDWPIPCVDVDGGLGIALATQHLLDLGHARIAVLGWPPGSRVGNNRMEGYLSTLAQAGQEIRPELVQRGEGRVEFGYHATHSLLDLPEDRQPTAIVAFNDSMAIGAMHAARERGLRIGTDLAITGFDDSAAGQYNIPPLTSVQQPFWEAGQQVIRSLLTALESGRAPEARTILLPPRLVIRESSTGAHTPLFTEA